MIVVVLLVAVAGTYYLAFGGALPPSNVPANDLAKGLVYDGLKRGTGPCADEFQDSSPSVSPNGQKSCTHVDPGPPGVDVQQRAKKIDAELTAQNNYDKLHPPKAAGAPGQPAPMEPADIGSKGDLGAVTPNYQACADAGSGSAYAYRLVYAYPAGGTNRFSSVRDNLTTIARRVNAVMYQSSIQNGGQPRQIRFYENSDCSFSFRVDTISGNISDFGNVKKQLRAQGATSPYHKFLVWVDGGTGCGQGDEYIDSRAGQDNANNTSNDFAVVWKGCWNYGEPHELMHTLGSVSINYSKDGYVYSVGSPHHTQGGHCWDKHDVMCYDDGTTGSGKMSVVCSNTINIWRYDCNKDDYFNSKLPVTSGYLSKYWNTANSRFLVHY
jgi:hypothetical protein